MFVLNANDAVMTAIEIARRGEKIYERAAGVSHPSLKHTLAKFASDAAKHKKIFKAIGIRMRIRNISDEHFEKKYLDYLQSLLNSHAAYCGGEPVRNRLDGLDMLELIHLASQAAKDTILYLNEIMDLLPATEVALVKECYDDQRRQFQQLCSILARYAPKKNTADNRHAYNPMQAAV